MFYECQGGLSIDWKAGSIYWLLTTHLCLLCLSVPVSLVMRHASPMYPYFTQGGTGARST